ncbi:MAG: formate dehydrogenase subunit gamma, partial [Mesorhizobium sp.]
MPMQPASTEIASRIAAIIEELKDLEGPLLPILHDIQEEFGHVPQAALPVIADGLNLSRAEVHGVVTFYHDFRAKPAGRHVLKLC